MYTQTREESINKAKEISIAHEKELQKIADKLYNGNIEILKRSIRNSYGRSPFNKIIVRKP